MNYSEFGIFRMLIVALNRLTIAIRFDIMYVTSRIKYETKVSRGEDEEPKQQRR